MFDFDEALVKAESPDDIKKMKVWMFKEQVKIQSRQEELQEFNRELQDLKRSLERARTSIEIREKTIKKAFSRTMKYL